MARAIAKLLYAERIGQTSNEGLWKGRRGVIKSCRPGTSSIGVTIDMFPRLDLIMAAFENAHGQMEVWEVSADQFRAAMYDSRSRAGSSLQMLRRAYAQKVGRPIAVFQTAAVKAAAS